MHGGAYPHRGPIGAALDGMTEVRDEVRHRGVEDLHDGADRRGLLLRRPRQEPPQIGQRFIDHVREIGPPDHLHAQGHLVDRRRHARARRPERHRAGREAQPRRQLRRVPLRLRAGQRRHRPVRPEAIPRRRASTA